MKREAQDTAEERAAAERQMAVARGRAEAVQRQLEEQVKRNGDVQRYHTQEEDRVFYRAHYTRMVACPEEEGDDGTNAMGGGTGA